MKGALLEEPVPKPALRKCVGKARRKRKGVLVVGNSGCRDLKVKMCGHMSFGDLEFPWLSHSPHALFGSTGLNLGHQALETNVLPLNPSSPASFYLLGHLFLLLSYQKP